MLSQDENTHKPMDEGNGTPFKRSRLDSFASLEETHRLLDYDLDLEEVDASHLIPPPPPPSQTQQQLLPATPAATTTTTTTDSASTHKAAKQQEEDMDEDAAMRAAMRSTNQPLFLEEELNAAPLNKQTRIPSLLPRRNCSALDYLIKAKHVAGMTTSAAQQEWKKLTRTEKHVFETLAKEDMERYQRELVDLAKRALAASMDASAAGKRTNKRQAVQQQQQQEEEQRGGGDDGAASAAAAAAPE